MPDVNVQYILAVTLLDGRLSFEAAHDYERMQRPDVQAMKARVHLEVDLEMDRVGPRYQALVEVSTTGGEQLREHIVNVRGRPENPMSPEEVEEKRASSWPRCWEMTVSIGCLTLLGPSRRLLTSPVCVRF